MPRLLALLLAPLLVLTACSDSDSGSADTCEAPAEEGDGGDVTAGATISDVSDDLAAPPTFQLAGEDAAPDELVVDDVVEGEGAEVAEGSSVQVQYVGTLTNCEQFDSSWATGQPISFTLGEVIQGWNEGLLGMKEGGRRALVIPPDLGYGADGSPPVIPPDATLVFVVDLVSVAEPLPAGATVTGVSTDLAAAPTFDVEGTDEAPTELVVEDVVEGDGAEVTEGATVEVQYAGTLSNGEEFDSSWTRGEPASFTLGEVIEGWNQGLVGMKVGGRRVLVIPSDLGYGPQGSPPTIPPDATLVFVVDLLSVG
jgi:peptidylprolyl isomerase